MLEIQLTISGYFPQISPATIWRPCARHVRQIILRYSIWRPWVTCKMQGAVSATNSRILSHFTLSFSQNFQCIIEKYGKLWCDLLCPRLQNVSEIHVAWVVSGECANIYRLTPRSCCPQWWFHLFLKHFNNRRLNSSVIIETLLECFCLYTFHEITELLVPYFIWQNVCWDYHFT